MWQAKASQFAHRMQKVAEICLKHDKRTVWSNSPAIALDLQRTKWYPIFLQHFIVYTAEVVFKVVQFQCYIKWSNNNFSQTCKITDDQILLLCCTWWFDLQWFQEQKIIGLPITVYGVNRTTPLGCSWQPQCCIKHSNSCQDIVDFGHLKISWFHCVCVFTITLGLRRRTKISQTTCICSQTEVLSKLHMSHVDLVKTACTNTSVALFPGLPHFLFFGFRSV